MWEVVENELYTFLLNSLHNRSHFAEEITAETTYAILCVGRASEPLTYLHERCFYNSLSLLLSSLLRGIFHDKNLAHERP